MDFTIQASLVTDKPQNFSFVLSPSEFKNIGSEYSFPEGLNCSGSIVRMNNHLKLLGTYTAHWGKPCDRCLSQTDRNSEGNLELTLAPATFPNKNGSLNQEFFINEVEIDYYEEDRINLGIYFESQFILDSDYIFICAENCLGLCAVCGVNKNHSSCNCDEHIKNRPFSVLRNLNSNKA